MWGLRQVPNCIISASMNPNQCRMARAGLGWSVPQLAERSKVAARTIARFESGLPVKPETAEALRSALVQGGVLFIDVDGRQGVTLRKG